MPQRDVHEYRAQVEEMFNHGFEGYLKHAFPLDELRPLSCKGHDTWGSYGLTLIDALDTLAVLGQRDAFARWVHHVGANWTFDMDKNVSVFETNIRILGGLLSAHLFAERFKVSGYGGRLLELAADLGERLLKAFSDSPSGIPYGTVNLRHGVPPGETTITSTAGAGTFSLEFGVLSALTGDTRFAKAAKKAVKALWSHRTAINLVGNHIDIRSGQVR